MDIFKKIKLEKEQPELKEEKTTKASMAKAPKAKTPKAPKVRKTEIQGYLNEFKNLPKQERKLVFGLGAGLIYGLGYNWKEKLPALLKTFPNDFLVSTVDIPMTVIKIIGENVDADRIYIDSGGFTLFKTESKLGKDNPEFHKECNRMRNKFLKILSCIRCKECFELDNEYFRVDEDLLSPRNYCREEIKEKTGFYPTPVFKMHQGFEYWKRLCESDLYPKLAISGLAQTKSWNTHTEELKNMMDYARQFNKKVHLLGCQNVEAFKSIQPDTVDYSIFQMAINMSYARQEHPELLEYRELSPHAVCYAVARALARSFLYDCFGKE